MANGEKATIREVINMLDPLKEDTTTIKTLLTTHLVNYKEYCDENKKEHKGFITIASIKTIGTILGLIFAIGTGFNIYMTFFVR